MIEVQPQPSMPSIAGHFRSDFPQELQYPRHPLTQLHNQAPSAREGLRQAPSWADHFKGVPQPTHAESYHSSYTPPTSGSSAAPANLMLAPTHGSLYRVNGSSNELQRHGSRPQSPLREANPSLGAGVNASIDVTATSSSSEADQIAPYLQIPATINSSKGSLSEFAAQITCLFWFESSYTLHRVEGARNTPMPMNPLVSEAKPSLGFQKWVTTILSTTQVSTNVILLALMFIYRLKRLNPTVKGKAGSEYRLLTVALMLGNKFLDDNTYTNKTWAEVSGISVAEIHIMEVEFLSNMRYTLYASHDEWWAWHEQLSRFYDYFERASRAPNEITPMTPFTPSSNHHTPYSSPPVHYISSPGRPQLVDSAIQPIRPPTVPAYLPPTIPSTVVRMPEVDLRPQARKRSYDESLEEPQAKRVFRNPSVAAASINMATPRLPVPNPSRPVQQTNTMPSSYSTHLPYPSSRAMSSVYGPQTPQSSDLLKPQFNALPNLGIKIPPMDFPQDRVLSSAAGSKSGSPVNAIMTPTTELLSPMNYSIHRSSPYRPVRAVNTLLVPPPSASLQNPSQNVGSSDMHYQPLGKTTERRTGVVPHIPQPYPPYSWGHHNPYPNRP